MEKEKQIKNKSKVAFLLIIFLIVGIVFFLTLFGLVTFGIGYFVGETSQHNHMLESFIDFKKHCESLNMTINVKKDLTYDQFYNNFLMYCEEN